jgi:hypothetical protein
VKSDTNIRIEEWLSSTTYLPVAPPADDTEYTLYSVYHFVVDSWTDTTITTYSGFWDTDGAAVVPAAGSLYELYNRPNYNIHVEYSTGQVRIANNNVRRGWSDQVSIYGNRAIIQGNLVEDGEDMGITLNGTSGVGASIVSGNKIRHQGAAGIFVSASNSVVANNMIERTTWVNHHNLYTMGGIQVIGSTDLLVTGNLVDGADRTLSRAGIAVHSEPDTENVNVTIVGNHVKGTSFGGIVIYGEDNINTQLRNNRATIAYQNGAVGIDSGQLHSTDFGVAGTPESFVIAGPGSTFASSTGKLYLKEAGTGSTGWALLATTGQRTGRFSVCGTSSSADILFPAPEVDSNYNVVVTPTNANTYATPGSSRVRSIGKSLTGFTARFEAAPGTSKCVTFDWVLAR